MSLRGPATIEGNTDSIDNLREDIDSIRDFLLERISVLERDNVKFKKDIIRLENHMKLEVNS